MRQPLYLIFINRNRLGDYAQAARHRRCLPMRSSAIILLWARSCAANGLVVEKTDASEGHHHSILVAGFNDVIIPDGAAWLGHIFHAALMGTLDIVAEGEERV